jgi:hypothetical protein
LLQDTTTLHAKYGIELRGEKMSAKSLCSISTSSKNSMGQKSHLTSHPWSPTPFLTKLLQNFQRQFVDVPEKGRCQKNSVNFLAKD